MHTYWITPQGLERFPPEVLPELLKRDDGFVWLDVPAPDEHTSHVLTDVFGFHPISVRDCYTRAPIPKIHAYHDHFFLVLYSVHLDDSGKLQQFQTNTFIHESRYLVTVHGPHGDGADIELATRETRAALARIESGRFLPRTPGELGHALVGSVAHHLQTCVAQVAAQVSRLENSVTRGRLREYERMLEGLFQVRHNLQTVRTIAAQSREAQARMLAYARGLRSESALWLQDLVDHFDRLTAVCDGEKELLQEVLDLYQTRVANDLSHLVRRLTAFGAILVSDTLVAGIYGMNFRHMPELEWAYGYPMALGVMVLVSLLMAWYFRSKDWL